METKPAYSVTQKAASYNEDKDINAEYLPTQSQSLPSKPYELDKKTCALCRGLIDLLSTDRYTCRLCFRFYHITCSTPIHSICRECVTWKQNQEHRRVNSLASVQHRSGFMDIPSATNKLFSAALRESQRKESWLSKATLEQITGNNERINKMPTLGERMASRRASVPCKSLQ